MNVSEFAERVVFGTTLEEKLTLPHQLDFGEDGNRPRIDSLVAPGRPDCLRVHNGPGAAQRPRDAELENEQARGRLLHFLANHELLATELMALALLKFPDAPPAFRRGVLATLREEQVHTRLYLQRMKECGVEFGSFPLSGHFWRMVEPMREPIDFVSRLSLTFEQANLDYSRHFAAVFQQLGDEKTARLLDRIYRDEIGHVQHGLHWFRQWKDPAQTDWEAYQACLTFPMSPQRARGEGAFNREGRSEAGLSDDFIDAIEVYRQSRGRTPTVCWFDPAAEAELAREMSTRERQLLHQLGKDLEGVMVAMSKQDDIVLVRRLPSLPFRKQLLDVGVDLPEFVPFGERAKLGNRKLHNFLPWAWTPRNHEIVAPLLAAARDKPVPWRVGQLDLFRKSWGAERLRAWLEVESCPSCFVSDSCVGAQVQTVADVAPARARLAELGFSSAIVKHDLATSGRGQRRLTCDQQLSDEDEAWLRSAFGAGTGGVVEPELDRVLDLSFLWHHTPGDALPTFQGWTRQLVTPGRRFAGTRLGRPFAGCDQQLTRFLLADNYARLHELKDWLAPRIASELNQRGFYGHFGIDAFVCRQSNGDLRIKPLVELNPRVTMGHVALNLERRLAPGVLADFRILTRREWKQANHQLSSISFARSRDGRWKSGVVWLGEIQHETKLIPALLIGADAIAAIPPADTV